MNQTGGSVAAAVVFALAAGRDDGLREAGAAGWVLCGMVGPMVKTPSFRPGRAQVCLAPHMPQRLAQELRAILARQLGHRAKPPRQTANRPRP